MKSRIVLIIVAFLLIGCNSKKDQVLVEIAEIKHYGPQLVLMHPTEKNIKTILSLINDGIFPLPLTTKLLGFYHSSESYDYNQSLEYIQSEGIDNVKLLKVTEDLSLEELYQSNKLTGSFKEVFENSNGVIFFGGPDLPPSTYGEETNLLTLIEDIHRHYFELSFLFHLMGGSQDSLFVPFLESNRNYNILGICLGMQSMNVAAGGTMVQDIPSELYGINTAEKVLGLDPSMRHRNYYTNFGLDKDLIWGSFHEIIYSKESLLDSLNGYSEEKPFVWSSHHQAIEELGKNIEPIGWSVDGKVYEAVYHKLYPNVLGVQFHPEVTSIYNPNIKLNRELSSNLNYSYLDLYPESKGEDFHRAFWRHIAKKYKKN